MADKSIEQLPAADKVFLEDLFVLQQSNMAKKLPGQVLLNWLTAAADGHGGIQSIVKQSTSGLKDTYRITLADTTIFDFVVTNGRAISSIKQTAVSGLTRTYTIAFNDNSSETFKITDGRSIIGFSKTDTAGLVDTYTLTYNDGTTGSIQVTNGAKGDKGDNSYVWIKYASQQPTASSHSFGDVPDAWIGVYSGGSSTAPTDWQQYKWYQFKGNTGDTGAPATVIRNVVEYQASDSGTIIPSGSWSTSVPVVSQGRYLWTKTTTTFNSGSPAVSYSVSRMGIDGIGSVVSVAGISPDANGNIPLTAKNVGALPDIGGDLTGELRMNGQPISGLNTPTANNQAANKGYVDSEKQAANTYTDEQVKKIAPHNYVHNSDFTHFIAQAGVGGTHGNQSYAGDRWILVSGTVTGNEGTIDSGYNNIKLNGTIKQIVANPPAVGSVFVEMVSGTATASYENGEVTITSNNGVIKNVALYEGVYETAPKYQPKGYGAELAECMRYYQNYPSDVFWFTVSPDNVTRFTILFHTPMRIAPTLKYTFTAGNGSQQHVLQRTTPNGFCMDSELAGTWGHLTNLEAIADL